MRPVLGTFVEIGADTGHSHANIEQAINAAFFVIQTIHDLLSFHELNSELTRLNQAHGAFINVHNHTIRVLRLARGMMISSEGLFNCTVGGMMVDSGVLPNHGGHAAPSGRAGDIEIKNGQVKLNRNVKITLDGIAKGYAVDCAIAVMKRHGVASGWVNAGGDLRVYGNMTLPVQRRELDGSFTALGSLQNAALASSHVGVECDANFPGRIVGERAIPALGIWSVMSHFAWRADALTKVASLANEHDRDDIVSQLGGKMVYLQQVTF